MTHMMTHTGNMYIVQAVDLAPTSSVICAHVQKPELASREGERGGGGDN